MSAQEDFDLFGKVAEMLGLDEDESGSFLESAMRRRGHKPKTQWEDGDGNDGNDGGDFFSRRNSGNRNSGGNRERKVNKGWQYGS